MTSAQIFKVQILSSSNFSVVYVAMLFHDKMVLHHAPSFSKSKSSFGTSLLKNGYYSILVEIPESKTFPKNCLVQVAITKRKNQRSNPGTLIFWWLLSVHVKIDAAIFDFTLANNYEGITKK